MAPVRTEFNEFLLMMAKQQDQTFSREALAEAFRSIYRSFPCFAFYCWLLGLRTLFKVGLKEVSHLGDCLTRKIGILLRSKIDLVLLRARATC